MDQNVSSDVLLRGALYALEQCGLSLKMRRPWLSNGASRPPLACLSQQRAVIVFAFYRLCPPTGFRGQCSLQRRYDTAKHDPKSASG